MSSQHDIFWGIKIRIFWSKTFKIENDIRLFFNKIWRKYENPGLWDKSEDPLKSITADLINCAWGRVDWRDIERRCDEEGESEKKDKLVRDRRNYDKE